MDGRRDCRRSVLRRMLRRLPCALLALEMCIRDRRYRNLPYVGILKPEVYA